MHEVDAEGAGGEPRDDGVLAAGGDGPAPRPREQRGAGEAHWQREVAVVGEHRFAARLGGGVGEQDGGRHPSDAQQVDARLLLAGEVALAQPEAQQEVERVAQRHLEQHVVGQLGDERQVPEARQERQRRVQHEGDGEEVVEGIRRGGDAAHHGHNFPVCCT